MADSSFYGDTPNYATSYPTQNDGNSNPNGDKPAPSSFYPNGGGYVPLAVAADTLAAMTALEAQAAADAANAATSATNAATSATNAATAVQAAAGTATPIVDGTATVGTGVKWAREDHIHPTDTSRAALTQVVRYDAAQSLTAAQQAQARSNVYAAPFDALSYNGMQVNGSFEVDQLNAGTSVAVPAGPQTPKLMDGWFGFKSGTNAFSVQQVASVFPGYAKAFKLTVTTAQASMGADFIDIRQSIEGYRVSRLAWGTASASPLTIGFWVKSSVAGVMTLILTNSAGTNFPSAPVTITSAGVAQFVTVTFSGDTTGTWLTDNGSGIQLVIRVAGTGQMNIAATNGNTFEMTGVVILPGIEVPSAARAPLIMRPADQELLTCRRYLEISTVTVQSGGVGTSINIYGFKATKRATPTMTTLATPGYTNAAGAGFNSPSVDSIGLQFTTTASGGFASGWQWMADARF
jgi:hypothetical protein